MSRILEAFPLKTKEQCLAWWETLTIDEKFDIMADISKVAMLASSVVQIVTEHTSAKFYTDTDTAIV